MRPIASPADTRWKSMIASSRNNRAMTIACLFALAGMAADAGEAPRVIKHVVVYRESGRFGGWPANHGIWSWGDEILAGFSAAYFLRKPPDRHPYDHTRPEEPRLARSLDGGETWSIEAPRS